MRAAAVAAASVVSIGLGTYPVAVAGRQVLLVIVGCAGAASALGALLWPSERIAARLTGIAALAFLMEYAASLILAGEGVDALAPAVGGGLLALIELIDLARLWGAGAEVSTRLVERRTLAMCGAVASGAMVAFLVLIASAGVAGARTPILVLGVTAGTGAVFLLVLRARRAIAISEEPR